MGSFFRFFAAAAALSLVLGSAAQAADQPRGYPSAPLPSIEMPSLLVDEFSSGWYLRGDVAYRKNDADNVTNEGTRAVIADDFSKAWLIGVGAGYKLQWFRADFTLDYGPPTKYKATTADMVDDFTAELDTLTGMVNVYGDLGTWFGLTPYIGAGIGTARLSVMEFTQHFQPAVPIADTRSEWNLAWAWMAGVSYSVFGKYHIDVGYRHINMGTALTGMDDYGNRLTFDNVTADEVRVGFRYMID